MVLLGLRTAIREDCGASPAQMALGATLRVPGSFFEGKEVTAAGEATIGMTTYDTAVLDATLWGKLSPDGTKGTEWGTFTLTLDDGDLVCDGTIKVKRYAVAEDLWTLYGESGKFRADCDGAKVMGEFVGEPPSNGSPGFLVTMNGAAR